MIGYEIYFDVERLRFNNFYKETDKSKNIKLETNSVNYNLILNKYIIQEDEVGKSFKTKKYKDNFEVPGEILNYINHKNEKIIEVYEKKYGYKKVLISAETISKLIVSHGEVSVREVSIKLDHIYGVPFIPASSIKGAFRNYMNEEYVFIKGSECLEAKDAINHIFGTQDNKGSIIFLDTYPRNCIVGIDIMTPHYGDYSSTRPPSDDSIPIPIKFPVVKEGAQFDFTILYNESDFKGKRSKDMHKDKEKKYGIYDIRENFEQFLKNKPLGAKTSVDYGRFK